MNLNLCYVISLSFNVLLVSELRCEPADWGKRVEVLETLQLAEEDLVIGDTSVDGVSPLTVPGLIFGVAGGDENFGIH